MQEQLTDSVTRSPKDFSATNIAAVDPIDLCFNPSLTLPP